MRQLLKYCGHHFVYHVTSSAVAQEIPHQSQLMLIYYLTTSVIKPNPANT